MKLGLKKSTKRWRAYGRSNSSVLISSPDLRIILYDSKNREIATVKKVRKEKNAKDELEKLSKLLELEMCFVQRYDNTLGKCRTHNGQFAAMAIAKHQMIKNYKIIFLF